MSERSKFIYLFDVIRGCQNGNDQGSVGLFESPQEVLVGAYSHCARDIVGFHSFGC